MCPSHIEQWADKAKNTAVNDVYFTLIEENQVELIIGCSITFSILVGKRVWTEIIVVLAHTKQCDMKSYLTLTISNGWQYNFIWIFCPDVSLSAMYTVLLRCLVSFQCELATTSFSLVLFPCLLSKCNVCKNGATCIISYDCMNWVFGGIFRERKFQSIRMILVFWIAWEMIAWVSG